MCSYFLKAPTPGASPSLQELGFWQLGKGFARQHRAEKHTPPKVGVKINPSHLEVALKMHLVALRSPVGGCRGFGKGKNPPCMVGSNLGADELLSNSFLPQSQGPWEGKSTLGMAGRSRAMTEEQVLKG